MVGVSIIVLRLPNNTYVFQRRDDNTKHFPLHLGFFGGHIEEGESPHQAAIRELGEETSLPVHELDLKKRGSCKLRLNEKRTITFHVYHTDISTDDFAVYEGDGAETYSLAAIMNRDDVTPGTRHIIKTIL